MAITLTIQELQAALRLGNSEEETAEVERLYGYVAEAVNRHAPEATDTAMNEAARRLAGYLFDMPEAGRGMAYANALRNSGAAAMLLPYRPHRLGLATEGIAAAIGTPPGNPVTGLAVESGKLVVTFADGSTDELDLPAGNDVGQTDIFDGRLPGPAVAFRMGWTFEDTAADATTFIRDGNHPSDGASEGTTAGLEAPSIPAVLFAEAIHFTTAKDYRFHVWIAGALGLVSLLDAYGDNWIGEFTNEGELIVDGEAGILYSEIHSRTNEDGIVFFSGIIPGSIIATQPWVAEQIAANSTG